ncbi:hypothetical protein TNCV_4509891 [Trichonephila clavipes]|nr:hypothetical protein TNCV_4509891 [Trichonephila clavipes]
MDSWPADHGSSKAPLKTHRVERLIHVKPVKSQNPPIDVVWELVEGVPVQVSSLNHLNLVKNHEVSY